MLSPPDRGENDHLGWGREKLPTVPICRWKTRGAKKVKSEKKEKERGKKYFMTYSRVREGGGKGLTKIYKRTVG